MWNVIRNILAYFFGIGENPIPKSRIERPKDATRYEWKQTGMFIRNAMNQYKSECNERMTELMKWKGGNSSPIGSIRDDWRNIGNDMRKIMGKNPSGGTVVGKIIYHGESGKLLHVLHESTPEEIKLQVEWQSEICDRIYEIMERKGITTQQLADRMNIEDVEVRSLICAQNDFTLSSLAVLSVALDENIIKITSDIN